MNKIKAKLQAAVHWLVNRMPEMLLVLFLVSLIPLLYLLGQQGLRLWHIVAASPAEFATSLRQNPWPVLAWAACVLGSVAAGWLLVRCWGPLWAVARKMIIEALHRKVVLVLLVFFVILMPSLPFILKTEGNPKSQIQIVISYSLVLAEVLLSVLAVFVCTASICTEVERKQVHVTDTKPLARWQFLVGKLLGTVVMCAALLFLMGASVYGLVRWMARERSFSHLPRWEEQKQQEMLRKVSEEVLVARHTARPSLPDVSAEVEAEIQRMRNEGSAIGVPSLDATMRKDTANTILKHRMTVPSLGMLAWRISGLSPGRDEPVYLRFKPTRTNANAPQQVLGTWWFYQREKAEGSAAAEPNQTRLTLLFRRVGRWQTGGYQEISVDSGIIDASGTVYLGYRNLESTTGIQFDPHDGIEILQRTESFFPNYYRSLVIILCHLVLLSALALMAGAALSFPVASFLVVAVLIVGLIGPWIEGMNLGYIPRSPMGLELTTWQEIGKWSREVLAVIIRALLVIFPQFTKYSPLGDLVNGRLVTWSFLGQAAADTCFLRALPAMLVGIYLYGRRELARVIA